MDCSYFGTIFKSCFLSVNLLGKYFEKHFLFQLHKKIMLYLSLLPQDLQSTNYMPVPQASLLFESAVKPKEIL